MSIDQWLTFQRRFDGSVDFYRTLTEYENGFGNVNGEFWLGLKPIHQYTSTGNWRLRVELEDFGGSTRHAEYESFSVTDSSGNYRLSLGSYSGNAKDAMTYNNNHDFSTKDHGPKTNCAENRKGGWWYDSCTWANLNGLFLGSPEMNWAGLTWHQWKNIECMKKTLMKMCRYNWLNRQWLQNLTLCCHQIRSTLFPSNCCRVGPNALHVINMFPFKEEQFLINVDNSLPFTSCASSLHQNDCQQISPIGVCLAFWHFRCEDFHRHARTKVWPQTYWGMLYILPQSSVGSRMLISSHSQVCVFLDTLDFVERQIAVQCKTFVNLNEELFFSHSVHLGTFWELAYEDTAPLANFVTVYAFFSKNYNTSVTSKICFLYVAFQGT